MQMPLLAWIADEGDPDDGCLLVFAHTRNKARVVASNNGIAYGFLDEYVHVRCRRVPKFDKWYRGKNIIDTNYGLPEGAPNFYSEEF